MKPKDYVLRNTEEIVSRLDRPFTSYEVYEMLGSKLKVYPTHLEFRHMLPRMPFIEKVGRLGTTGVDSRVNLYRFKG